jgi:hypothetical protein
MSAIRSKHEVKTILDFSDVKNTQIYIKQSLKTAEFNQIHYHDNGIGVVYVDHEIQVGMYKITLLLNCSRDAKLLKDYGRFSITISEYEQGSRKSIDLKRDRRFKHQSWIDYNENEQLNISKLTDIIIYCNRLNRLKSFL